MGEQSLGPTAPGVRPRMSRDYLLDVAYPAFFHREQAPLWLSSVCAALGRAAQTSAGSHWCELGCGQGFGAAVLASANPGMRFTGVDLSRDHIELARTRASAAGLENLNFICADIRDPGAIEGKFDFVVSHGVLSWVSDEVRSSIAAAAARYLRAGGIAALHYMSEPGGAAFRAFHGVFRAVADRPDPVAEGLAVLQAMRKAKAGFFQLHPHAEKTLDNLLGERPAYIVHEYMNPSFRPLPFAEVNGLMEERGLRWLGSATPIENIDAVSIPGEAAKAIRPVKDTVLRETMKDMARNQPLRYDLFAEPQAEDIAAHLAMLRSTIWTILPGAPPPGRLTFDTFIGPVEGDATIFRPLIERLRKGAASFDALERIAPFTGRPGLLNQALQMALWAGFAHPCVARPDIRPAARLNRLLLDDARAGRDVPALSAPAIGSGISVSRQRLAELCEGKGEPRLRKLLCLG